MYLIKPLSEPLSQYSSWKKGRWNLAEKPLSNKYSTQIKVTKLSLKKQSCVNQGIIIVLKDPSILFLTCSDCWFPSLAYSRIVWKNVCKNANWHTHPNHPLETYSIAQLSDAPMCVHIHTYVTFSLH